MFDAFIKVGGSLFDKSELQASAARWSMLAAQHRLLLLPGGGPFADQVRTADTRFNLSDSAAHWMAILSMDQYAYLLADLAPNAVLVRDLTTAAATCTAGHLAILAPSTLLLQLDPMPHSWQVTSDSIAAWLAAYAHIQLLILLKSVAGASPISLRENSGALIPRVPVQSLPGYNLVDPYFAQTLSAKTTCWILDGRRPERLAELLSHGSTVGTRIVGA